MVRIRYRRVGGKKQASYRLVIADQHSARNGGIIESVGYHNPRTVPSTDIVDEARVLYWLSVGAQPSEAVVPMLKRAGTMARFERLKKGESLGALVAEADAARAAAGPISPRTRYPAPEAGKGTFKPKEG